MTDVVIPPGWKLVPEEPTEAMMDAGLYQSSHDSDWADVWQAYVDMVRAAPTPDLQKPEQG
jgi:hypothetical protein